MISVLLSGRLGNQMFQYSVCRVVAEKNNYKFHIPKIGTPSTEGSHLKNFFPKLEMGTESVEIRQRFIEDHSIQKFNENIFSIKDFTEICGFYQSPKYFLGFESKIREWFNIQPDEMSKKLLEKYNPSDYCFIHVRGTDYRNHGHWFLEKSYYIKAMDYMKSVKKDISFVIITDDTDQCSEWFPNIQSFKNEMIVDFTLLSASKYLIIPNSTFSWWPAWLNKKMLLLLQIIG